MDIQTFIDNVIFWGIFLPVIWLVWESNKPKKKAGATLKAHWFLFKQNWWPILVMKCHKPKS